ncbi:MAG TPA: DUF1569 domain-containing protein [Mucilaginibacter sp.]|jgi:hypothetical protein|nr:DUF1569 domain-containing protein [Mucilaginibacter sp.]
MKTMLDKATREELIRRIEMLNAKSTPRWGKMTVYQMLKHCSQWEELALGRKKYKRMFMGYLFGKIALKDMLKDEPVKQNLPTVPSFKMTGSGDVTAEKANWISLLHAYDNTNVEPIVHPFFGKMTPEQIGTLDYKHADHHLKQFGC